MTKLTAGKREKLPEDKFALPEKRAYPIEDEAHARNAKARARQATEAGRLSKTEERTVDRKADAMLNKS